MEQNKKTIQTEFKSLLSKYQSDKQQVATKEELVAWVKKQETVKKAATYTIDNIIKNLSELQLDFSGNLEDWSSTLSDESEKYNELKDAIKVETERLERLREVKLAADALYLLKEEHQTRLKALEEQFEKSFKEIDEEKIQLKADWKKEQETFDTQVKEEDSNIEKERAKEKEKHQYEWERLQKIEKDKYEEDKKLLERSLAETDAIKQKQWKEREEKLQLQQKEYEENKQKIAEFDQKLKEEIKQETDKAASEVSKEIKAKQELIAKEEEANEQIGQHQIQTLEATIQRNEEEIAKLTEKYNQAIGQIQELSTKALDVKQI
jgi:DNA repair exonuclease SbcCD ATPase subunit